MRTLTPEAYVRNRMRKVAGYLSHLDAEVILHLLHWQDRRDIRGSLCEIGVHHGRLFLILALSRRPGEVALAIDLFEDDAVNTGVHAGRDGALQRNARMLGIPLSSEEIVKSSSHDLTADQIKSRAQGSIRFFSIDGGHLYGDVENDLRLAQQCISTDSIIAVDDFFSVLWPEVSFATYDFLRAQSEIVPICATRTKLYLAPRQSAQRILDDALSSLPAGLYFHAQSPVPFLGNKVAFVEESSMTHYGGKLKDLLPL